VEIEGGDDRHAGPDHGAEAAGDLGLGPGHVADAIATKPST
jgi:hypothetical protein